MAQLLLLLAVFWGFNIEGPGFLGLAITTVVAFVIHYFLPYAWKKLGFLILSLTGGVLVLALADPWRFGDARMFLPALMLLGVLMAVALAFYGVLRLPIPFLARLLGILALGSALWYARGKHALLPEAHWQVLGAIFMFRTIVYVYEVGASRKQGSLLDFLTYFFLLPNFHFVLFPVIDYSTFNKGHYAENIHSTAQRGIWLILKGTVQLCLHRIINHSLVIGALEVSSLPMLLRFIFPAYLLYTRVSGQFHVITGMLHLFGYRLPDANRNYLLASSFTDFWRRINIYWKDFMVKVFYYPVYFRLRKRSETLALALATTVVFVVTTVLHGYQMFWIQGTFEIKRRDALFWGILGVLVLFTVVYEARRGPAPKGARTSLLGRIVSVAGVYVTISVLWSMWSTEPASEWVDAVLHWRQ